LYGIIINDDKRYDYTQKYLEANNINIKSFDYNKLKDLKNINLKSKPDFILFTFREELNKNIFDDKFFLGIKKDALIFSGLENNYIKKSCEKNNLNYEPLMSLDYISCLNSVPTAEGVIYYLIKSLKKTIDGSDILIIGYGNCGKALADKLYKLNARVYINTKKDIDYAIAIINKIIPVYKLDFKKKKFDAIINTAPCETIFNSDLKFLSNKTLLIDITKSGFDINLAREKNIDSARILSIPSRFSPETAGEILGKYIYEKVTKCSKIKKLVSE
jgi:dipicolinate synthase subunit A